MLYVLKQDADAIAVEYGVLSDVQSRAVAYVHGGAVAHDSADHVALNDAVAARLEDYAVVLSGVEAVHEIARVAVKIVVGHQDVAAGFDEQVLLVTFPEGVASDGDTARVLDVDVALDVAEDIGGDGDVALAGELAASATLQRWVLARAFDADIGAARGLAAVLHRATSDGDLADAAAGRMKPHVRSRR